MATVCARNVLLAGGFAITAGCGKKNAAPPAPPVGWHQEAEGWQFACYFPPDWGAMNEMDRKMARASVLDEMITQWRGEREDGVTFKEDRIEELETTLLGRPTAIEGVATANLKHCMSVSTGKADPSPWKSWHSELPALLTEGECLTPFDYTMFDYLDIGTSWQRVMPICQGDRVRISGTINDKYRVSDDGPWITVAGDPNQPTGGDTDLPCNLEGCFAGMLVVKFASEDGVETILPVHDGQLIFEAPEHGEISYRINDGTYYDNTWFTNGGIVDHTAIEISPTK